jgi:hypothetical protein
MYTDKAMRGSELRQIIKDDYIEIEGGLNALASIRMMKGKQLKQNQVNETYQFAMHL